METLCVCHPHMLKMRDTICYPDVYRSAPHSDHPVRPAENSARSGSVGPRQQARAGFAGGLMGFWVAHVTLRREEGQRPNKSESGEKTANRRLTLTADAFQLPRSVARTGPFAFRRDVHPTEYARQEKQMQRPHMK